LREKEKIERDEQLAILEDDLRILRQKEEKIKNILKLKVVILGVIN